MKTVSQYLWCFNSHTKSYNLRIFLQTSIISLHVGICVKSKILFLSYLIFQHKAQQFRKFIFGVVLSPSFNWRTFARIIRSQFFCLVFNNIFHTLMIGEEIFVNSFCFFVALSPKKVHNWFSNKLPQASTLNLNLFHKSFASSSPFPDWLVSSSTHIPVSYCVKSLSILNKIVPNIGPSKGAWMLFWTIFQYVWIEPNLVVEYDSFYQMEWLFDCIIKPATGIFVSYVWKWKNKNSTTKQSTNKSSVLLRMYVCQAQGIPLDSETVWLNTVFLI